MSFCSELDCDSYELSAGMSRPDLVRAVKSVPSNAGIYALYGGTGPLFVAYVGTADNLRRRLNQHLVLRNSSVTAGTSIVSLHPDLVREVRWWTDPEFQNDSSSLLAAELIAFEVLEPALRSRGGVTRVSNDRMHDVGFVQRMRGLFAGDATGSVVIPSLQDALDRIEALEHSVAALRLRLDGSEDA
jgi:hypothetical protein